MDSTPEDKRLRCLANGDRATKVIERLLPVLTRPLETIRCGHAERGVDGGDIVDDQNVSISSAPPNSLATAARTAVPTLTTGGGHIIHHLQKAVSPLQGLPIA